MNNPAVRPIELCLQKWHQALEGTLEGGFAALLHPDVKGSQPSQALGQDVGAVKPAIMTAGLIPA